MPQPLLATPVCAFNVTAVSFTTHSLTFGTNEKGAVRARRITVASFNIRLADFCY